MTDLLNTDILHVGDKVKWRGCWGSDPEEIATVEDIAVNCINKEGINATEVEWYKVKDTSVIVGLTNGNWAYGDQIRRK